MILRHDPGYALLKIRKLAHGYISFYSCKWCYNIWSKARIHCILSSGSVWEVANYEEFSIDNCN